MIGKLSILANGCTTIRPNWFCSPIFARFSTLFFSIYRTITTPVIVFAALSASVTTPNFFNYYISTICGCLSRPCGGTSNVAVIGILHKIVRSKAIVDKSICVRDNFMTLISLSPVTSFLFTMPFSPFAVAFIIDDTSVGMRCRSTILLQDRASRHKEVTEDNVWKYMNTEAIYLTT